MHLVCCSPLGSAAVWSGAASGKEKSVKRTHCGLMIGISFNQPTHKCEHTHTCMHARTHNAYWKIGTQRNGYLRPIYHLTQEERQKLFLSLLIFWVLFWSMAQSLFYRNKRNRFHLRFIISSRFICVVDLYLIFCYCFSDEKKFTLALRTVQANCGGSIYDKR